MTNLINEVYFYLLSHINVEKFWHFLLFFFPFIFFIELPFVIAMLITIIRAFLFEIFAVKKRTPYFPSVTCIISCYNEGKDIIRLLRSLNEQLYAGTIEVLVMIDGAAVNMHTLNAAKSFLKRYKINDKRYFKIIPKWERGGHASSLNLGLKLAKGNIIVCIDGDCSTDNDAIALAIDSFTDPNVVGVSGSLRVRNAKKNILTRLQAIEYMLGVHLSRIGLGFLNILNNISGAFGIFRKDFLFKIGGWQSGSGEDLDLTLRIQAYFNRHKNLKLYHNPYAIVHTDVPDTWLKLFKQRLRWDGDIYYIYCYRHWRVLRPRFLGWKGFIGVIWYGLLIHMVLPFLIIFSMIYLFVRYGFSYTLTLLIITYVYYFITTSIQFIIYLLLVSERKMYDLSFIWVVPFLPVYQLIMRPWSAIAIIIEIVLKSHKESTMGPWWVNRKVR